LEEDLKERATDVVRRIVFGQDLCGALNGAEGGADFVGHTFEVHNGRIFHRVFVTEEMVGHKTLVLPGFVAVLSGKLQELSGWKVLVGPREAAGIPAFAKSRFGNLAAND